MTNPTSPGHALVVGATSRTGREIAGRLFREGWRLSLTARSMDRVTAVADSLRADQEVSGEVEGLFELDLVDGASIESFLAAWSPKSPLDLLVVAAAPFREQGIDSWTMEDFLEQSAAQSAGPALLAGGLKEPLSRSARVGGGAVVLFGDVHARMRPRGGATPYLSGKAAVESLVPILAIEMAPTRVFGISPGVIAWADDFDSERRERYLERVPLGRPGTVEEAASLVIALVDSATYTTGIVIPIDGGRHLR